MFGILRKRKNQPINIETLSAEALLAHLIINKSGVSVTDFVKHLKPVSISGLKPVCKLLSVPCSVGESRLVVLQRLHATLNQGY